MPSIPLIRASQLEPFAASLSATGARAEPLLASVGISPDLLEADSDALVSEYGVWAFADACARAAGYEAFGFDAGIATPIEHIGAFGREVRSAGTLRGALRLFLAAVSTHSSHASFSLVPCDATHVWFCRHGIDGIDVGSWQVEQYVLGLMIRLVRLPFHSDWRPPYVLLKQRSLRGLHIPPDLRDARVRTGSVVTAIALPVTALDVRLHGQALAAVPLDPIEADFAESLRIALEPMLDSGTASLEHAARLAGVSPRTVQRWLERQGRTFAQMLDEVRRDAALQLIREPGVRLRNIAIRLGYADPANFTRAFRRWTGRSPSDARRRLG